MSHARFAPLALAVVAFATAAVAEDDPPPVKVRAKLSSDQVDVAAAKKAVTISFRKSSISEATISRTGDAWPDEVTLRLYTHGLEHFTAFNGTETITAFAYSTGEKYKPSVHLEVGGKKTDVTDEKAEFYTPVVIFGAEGKPIETLPPDGGGFEVRLPKAFFAGNPKAITLEWIDFYRK